MAVPIRRRGRASRLAGGLAAVAFAAVACASSTSPGGSTTAGTPSPDPAPATTSAGPAPTVPALHPSIDDYPAGTVEVVTAEGQVHTVAVRIAETPSQRTHGLMEVPDLPEGVGMWFVYDEETTGGFWMKDTLVPLDIAYVGADGRVVSIADAEPCREEPCPTYEPEGPYQHVLEVAAGEFDRMGAGVGASVHLVDRTG